jgi:hypothetical protein
MREIQRNLRRDKYLANSRQFLDISASLKLLVYPHHFGLSGIGSNRPSG